MRPDNKDPGVQRGPTWRPDFSTPPMAAFFSLSGDDIRDEEITLFKKDSPLGFILFRRNIDSPPQLQSLTDNLREIAGWNCPIMIDQEGGRVARLQPPIWQKTSAARFFGDLYEDNDALAEHDIRDAYRGIAQDLTQCGINVNCAPVMDILTDATHDSIGDRAYSADPDIVGACGDIVCRTFLEHGVTPVIKHMPGHGRASVDSHHHLPIVDASLNDLQKSDFRAFRHIAQKDYAHRVWGMTSHILFSELDKAYPASVSRKIHQNIIRGRIGFDGFLVSDDINMKGLTSYGDVDKRALAALKAGSDAVLYCAGHIDEMQSLAGSLPRLSEESVDRLVKCHNDNNEDNSKSYV